MLRFSHYYSQCQKKWLYLFDSSYLYIHRYEKHCFCNVMSSKKVPFRSFKTQDDPILGTGSTYIDPEQNLSVDLIHMFKGNKQIMILNHQMTVTFILFGHKITGLSGLTFPSTNCIEVYIYMFVHLFIQIFICIHMYRYLSMHMCIDMYTFIYMHICIQIHIYMHICIHAYV
jgi:hypothetical protein